MADAAGWMGWIGLHFVLALAGTWLARKYALRHRLLDEPGERRAHAIATPRGGGISIVTVLLIAIAWLAAHRVLAPGLALAGGLGLGLVAAAGWLDDHRPVAPGWRLFAHAVAAGGLAWALWQAGATPTVALGGFALAVVLVNVWNFMDGIDALAASQALLVALAYAALAGGGAVAWLGLALAAACAGFLPFNLPKARIFLGDVGSGALGFGLALLAAMLALESPQRVPLLLLPLSAFMIDASLTLASRILHGARWWLPHAEHAYQRWTQRNGRHGVASVAYAGWTLAAGALMLAARGSSPAVIIMMLMGIFAVGALTWTQLRDPARRWGS